MPGWGGPPPQPPRGSNTGLIVGLSIAGVVVLLLIAAGVVGVMAVSDDSSKDGGPVARASASEPTAAPTDEAKEAPADEPSPQASDPEGDVRIDKCEVDSLTTFASAEVVITNRTSKESDYIVNVEFVDGSGKRLGDALAATSNLAPGQKAQETAQGLDEISGKMECRVTKVTRYQY
jgi:hypothetical protein